MIIRIAQIKVTPNSRQLQANHDRLVAILDEVAPHQPDVVITPEGYLDDYVGKDPAVTRESIADYAIDPTTSAYTREISAWAAAHNAWFVLGCARAAPEGVYDSTVIFNRDGRIAGIYDKIHIQTHDVKYAPGRSLPVFDSGFGPFGVMICADRRWPERPPTGPATRSVPGLDALAGGGAGTEAAARRRPQRMVDYSRNRRQVHQHSVQA